MNPTIEDLLEEAAVPTSATASFDVGQALRRLAVDAAKAKAAPPKELVRAAEASRRLPVISRWILNRPEAAAQIDRLARDTQDDEVQEEHLDIDGALVYGALLYLTGHPESAQFWWQLAAGAGRRTAAYCLHLHHLALGEMKEARHWHHQVTDTSLDSEAPDADFMAFLGAVALYVRRHGSEATGPTAVLEMEVDRLATRGQCVIVSGPDRRLANRLADFARR
ncbi:MULTISPECIES: hypothetical protein [unclassified Streptomyces]|uniref:hypothetical protein n=1 Tax=unclassified Streptomyces TaxID=2593676 RepID=UPI00365E6590